MALVVPVALLLAYGALRVSVTLFTELREFLFYPVAARIARRVADDSGRDVIVAGSIAGTPTPSCPASWSGCRRRASTPLPTTLTLASCPAICSSTEARLVRRISGSVKSGRASWSSSE